MALLHPFWWNMLGNTRFQVLHHQRNRLFVLWSHVARSKMMKGHFYRKPSSTCWEKTMVSWVSGRFSSHPKTRGFSHWIQPPGAQRDGWNAHGWVRLCCVHGHGPAIFLLKGAPSPKDWWLKSHPFMVKVWRIGDGLRLFDPHERHFFGIFWDWWCIPMDDIV